MAKTAAPASETPLQDALLERVRELTQEAGSRKRLAEELGILPVRIYEYLANPPASRPNGETTLKLQRWAMRTGLKKIR